MVKYCHVCKSKLFARNRAVGQGNLCKRCHSDRQFNFYWDNCVYREKHRQTSRFRNHRVGSSRDPNGVGSSQTQIIYETRDEEKLKESLEKEMKRLKLK